jgi:hypothetical protein
VLVKERKREREKERKREREKERKREREKERKREREKTYLIVIFLCATTFSIKTLLRTTFS